MCACHDVTNVLNNCSRVVHVSSRVSTWSLAKCSKEVKEKFINMANIDDVVNEMAAFVQ